MAVAVKKSISHITVSCQERCEDDLTIYSLNDGNFEVSITEDCSLSKIIMSREDMEQLVPLLQEMLNNK